MGTELVRVRPDAAELARAGSYRPAEAVVEEWLEEADAEAAAIVERARQAAAAHMDEAALTAEGLRAEAATEAATVVEKARASVATVYEEVRDLRHELAQVFDPGSDLVAALGRAAATLGELCGQADRALPPGPVTPALEAGAGAPLARPGPPLALPPEEAPAGRWRRLLPGRLTRRAA